MGVATYHEACTYMPLCLYYNTTIGCGPPHSVTNGTPGTPTSTTFGGIVTYTCDSGYSLSGSATVTCMSGGSWGTRPTCTGF